MVPVNLGGNGWSRVVAAADALRGIARADAGGLAMHVTGQLGVAADSSNASKGIDDTLLSRPWPW